MAKSLLDLAKRFNSLAGNIEKSASELAVKVADAVVTDLVLVTPADTSRALSNWQVGLGSPIDGTIAAYNVGKAGSTEQQSQVAAIRKARSDLKAKKIGEDIYISNSLHYIKYLDEGSSTQFPGGFKERAVLIGRKVLEKSKLVENGWWKNRRNSFG